MRKNIFLDTTVRQFYIYYRHSEQIQSSTIRLTKRAFTCSTIFNNNNNNKNNGNKPPSTTATVLAKQSGDNADKQDKTVVIENVIEQSLHVPTPPAPAADKQLLKEPPVKLMEKIIGLRDDIGKIEAAIGAQSAPGTAPTTITAAKAAVKKRKRVDFSAQFLERNFITPVRAMSDFLLKPSDLEALPKTKRRSPYENEPPITVYWRKDVEAKALNIWGSKEKLQKELLKRDIEKRMYQQSI